MEKRAELGHWECIFVSLGMAETDVTLAHSEGEFAGAPGPGVRKDHPSLLVLQSSLKGTFS